MWGAACALVDGMKTAAAMDLLSSECCEPGCLAVLGLLCQSHQTVSEVVSSLVAGIGGGAGLGSFKTHSDHMS